ncbi:hypothetical protein CKO51_31335 [Rhodopirellula sp. SM50]|nr:hypothetical protein CKO51_31335 [Rhodopirellula sp. SM50]
MPAPPNSAAASKPNSPGIRSFPSPPRRVSLPASPRRPSTRSPPTMRSLPLPPRKSFSSVSDRAVSVSFPRPPTISMFPSKTSNRTPAELVVGLAFRSKVSGLFTPLANNLFGLAKSLVYANTIRVGETGKPSRPSPRMAPWSSAAPCSTMKTFSSGPGTKCSTWVAVTFLPLGLVTFTRFLG